VSVVKADGNFVRGAGSPLGAGAPASGWCANLSVGATNPNATVLDPSPTAASVGYAFDWIYNRILFDDGQVGVVNLSMNTGSMGFYRNPAGAYTAEPNHPKVKRLATPAIVPIGFGFNMNYRGAFVVQSAGNKFVNACRSCDSTVAGFTSDYACKCSEPNCGAGNSQAYQSAPGATSANVSDGIMVIGAHHHTGHAVSNTLPFSDSYPLGVTGADSPSNFGACLDAWAPGNAIISSWGLQRNLLGYVQFSGGLPLVAPGPHTVVGTSYSASSVTPLTATTAGWLFLSGSSMAAPHIAGLGAYLADTFNLTSPAQIEQKVRAYFRTYGFTDAASAPVFTVEIP
jgi:subtilisin family serine protease